ncbi:MAG: dihydroneopterin aldolase [Verrucomicrobiia bacterium]
MPIACVTLLIAMDKIVISDLEVEARIGATEAERARPQRLLITVELERDLLQAGRTDDLAATADYAAVADLMRGIATSKPRNLVEALAEELAQAIISRKFADTVTVEVRKFSLPKSRFVAVRLTRSQRDKA